jgi:single-strand DNA-binding protein
MAETCQKWCPKGRGIRVVGRLKQNVYTSGDGKRHSSISIIAEHVEFKPLRKNDEEIPASADSGKISLSKKQKLAMLAQAAQAAQCEDDEIEF